MHLRRAEHQEKISANIVQVNDLLDEAFYLWKLSDASNGLCGKHVAMALAAKQRRTGRMSEAWLEEIKERQLY